MRIMIFGLNFAPEPTGIAPYTSKIAAGLQDRGHEVDVLTAFPHYPQWRIQDGYRGLILHEWAGEVRLTRLRHYVPRRPVGRARALSELSFGIVGASRPWGRPDVVVCVSPALLSTAVGLLRSYARRDRPAFGVIMQDLYSAGIIETNGGGRVAGRALSAIEAWVARSADGVAVIHDRLRDRVVDTMGVCADRVVTIRNWTHLVTAAGIDRRVVRESLGWREDETVVLHTGAMGEKQGLSNVVAAAREAERTAASVRFVLMGDGGQRRRLEAEARGLKTIQFLDPAPQEKYGEVLRSADVLLVNERPGVAEMAVPSKLTSYFSAGRPVLAATAVGSATAAEVDASGAGVTVAPDSPASLLAASQLLGADVDRAATLGGRGLRYCAEVLSESVALARYDRWVRELYEARRDRKG